MSPELELAPLVSLGGEVAPRFGASPMRCARIYSGNPAKIIGAKQFNSLQLIWRLYGWKKRLRFGQRKAAADGFLYTPEGSGPWPGVIQLTDIHGLRPVARDLAKRIAAKGYVVLLPNVFYRTGKAPLPDFQFKPGDEKSMARFRELAGPLTADAMESDGAAYVDFLAKQAGVSAGAMGVVGYCFTAAMAMRTAAARPGADWRVSGISRWEAFHRRSGQPAYDSIAHQGASLFRTRDR